jgi:DNA-binding MarR family transcriptional regulator
LTISEYNPAAPGPPLIGALLRRPWETVQERMLAGVHERGYTDLVAAHLTVMQYPGPQGLRPSELADRTRMTRQAVNYLLGELERLGYLERVADDSDHRTKRIQVTDRGKAAGTAMREIVLEVEADWTQQLGPGNFARLRNLLARLNQDPNDD